MKGLGVKGLGVKGLGVKGLGVKGLGVKGLGVRVRVDTGRRMSYFVLDPAPPTELPQDLHGYLVSIE